MTKDKFIFFALLVVCSIDLPSTVIVYGAQIGVISFLFLTILFRRGVVSTKYLLVSLSLSLFMIFITYIQAGYSPHNELIWKFCFRIVFWLIVFSQIYPYITELRTDIVTSCLSTWIYIYSLFLYVQFLAFYLFHIEIDYSILSGGEPSRMWNVLGLRPSGLTGEPSIYSGIMISMLALMFILNKKKITVIYFGLGSVFLTLSTLGVLLGVLFFILINLRKISFKKIVLVSFIGIITSGVLSSALLARYERFESGADVSNNVKFDIVDTMLSHSDIGLLGYGLVGKSESAPDYYTALYDLTLFGNLIVIFGIPLGIIISIVVVVCILRCKLQFYEKCLFILTLLKITIPNFIFFYVFICIISHILKNRSLQCEHNTKALQ